MFSLDKLIIKINKILRNLVFHIFFWYISLLFYVFLTSEQQILRLHLNLLEFENLYMVLLVLSICIGLLFTILDGLFTDRMLRFLPRRMMIFLKSLLYFASAFILMLVSAKPPLTLFTEQEYEKLLQHIPQMNIQTIRFLVYFYVMGFLINFFKGARKRMGRGNFRSWLLGMLNKPMEQERIFMFLDMRSSTQTAEKLSHKKFSHLIQDIFNDLSVVDNYQGEIYQYVGDGAIISWTTKDGLDGNNFLRAFYAFKKVIHRRRKYYRRKYGTEPRFKAGAHKGKVMVLQVGQIRRDISYNGDTINTAARIESMCNEYRQEFLISGELYNALKNKEGFNFKNVGNIKLRGRKKGIEVHGVKKK